MGNHVEKLKKRALELSETKNGLKEQKKINRDDLSIVDELFSIPLEDDDAISGIKSLSKTVNTEQSNIGENSRKNQIEIDDTSHEADDFINDLKSNLSKLEQMGKKSDLVEVGQQIKENESRITKLEEVKRLLEADSLLPYKSIN
jgi:hypothetical protein